MEAPTRVDFQSISTCRSGPAARGVHGRGRATWPRATTCVSVRRSLPYSRIDICPLRREIAWSELVRPADTAASVRPTRWGLGTKLFAILILLGAVAVLVTGILGYIRARDALEHTIYNHLTAARQTKARQVETYLRTVRNELRLLATSKMVVDAAREFRAAFAELEQADVPFKVRQDVGEWYAAQFVP